MAKIALVGYGYWGPNVARNLYRNPQYDLVYICDKQQARLDIANTVYANAVEYTLSFEDVIADESVEAVALAVETSAHYTLAKAALLAGKHVYVEKPFTDSVADAVELKQLAEERNLRIHVDHIMVFHPVIGKIKEIVASGELGDILYFDCSRINLGQLKNDVSSMWDLSVHDLSIIDFLTDGAMPTSINAMGKKIYTKQESVVFLDVMFDTFMASIRSSWLSPIKERRIIIAGTKKMIVYDDVDVLNKLIVYDKGFDMASDFSKVEYDEFVVKSRMGDGLIPKLEQGDALYNSLEHFRQCMISGKESITNADAGIRLLQILEEADKQLR